MGQYQRQSAFICVISVQFSYWPRRNRRGWRLPALRRAAVIRAWAIPVASTSDSRPLLGPVDGVEGLLVATALKSTIILTPLVGELVSGMVTGETQAVRLAEFSPSRVSMREFNG